MLSTLLGPVLSLSDQPPPYSSHLRVSVGLHEVCGVWHKPRKSWGVNRQVRGHPGGVRKVGPDTT